MVGIVEVEKEFGSLEMERNDLDELASVLTSRQSWPGHEVLQELLANVFLCPFYCSDLVLNLRSSVDGLARNIFILLEIAGNTIFLLVKGFSIRDRKSLIVNFVQLCLRFESKRRKGKERRITSNQVIN